MENISTQIKVITVTTFQEEQAFLDLPKDIYQDNPNWVPPLRSSVSENFAPSNPFFEYGELERFLAVRNNQVVGRIVSAINRRLIDVEKRNVGLFGFFECVEDLAVAEALLKTAQHWLQKRNMELVCGPINLSTDRLCLFLVDNFDLPPMFNTSYNPPYYPKFLEQLGWYKAKDAVGYIMDLDIAPSTTLERGYEIARKSGLSFRRIKTDPKHYPEECRLIHRLSIDSYAGRKQGWGYTPPTEAEFLRDTDKLRTLLNPDGVWIAEDPSDNNQMVGVVVGIPDYNMVLRHLNGNLNWWSKVKFSWYRRKINQARVILIASLPKYRSKMVSLALIYLVLTEGGQRGTRYRQAELSWVWEDNLPSRKLIEASGGKVYKTYRLYEKSLGS
jgi:hypothetical protein